MHLNIGELGFQVLVEPQTIPDYLPYILLALSLSGFLALFWKRSGLLIGFLILIWVGPCAVITWVDSGRENIPGYCVLADSTSDYLRVSPSYSCEPTEYDYTAKLSEFPHYFLELERSRSTNEDPDEDSFDLTLSLQHETGYLLKLKEYRSMAASRLFDELLPNLKSLSKIHNVKTVLQSGHILKPDGQVVLPFNNPFSVLNSDNEPFETDVPWVKSFEGNRPHWLVFCIGWTGFYICLFAIGLFAFMIKFRKEHGGPTIAGITVLLLAIGSSMFYLFLLAYSEWNTEFRLEAAKDSLQLKTLKGSEVKSVEQMRYESMKTVFCDSNAFTLRIMNINPFDHSWRISSKVESKPDFIQVLNASYDSLITAAGSDSLQLSIHHLRYPQRLQLCEHVARSYLE